MSDQAKNGEHEEGRPDCESVVRSLWDFIDAELDDASLEVIDRHLEACGHCRAHADFEQRLVDELAALRRQHSDPDSLKAQVEAALKELRTRSQT
jgi:anti-sigma factor (TIGR02949 family)